jgi:hypothetical protein
MKMHKVKVSYKTLRLIEENAIKPFRNTAERQSDGTYLMEVDDEVMAVLLSEQKEGEAMDETIRRVLIRKTCN